MEMIDARLSSLGMMNVIDEEMYKQRVSKRAMAEEFLVSRNTLASWMQKGTMPVWALLYIADILGISVKLVKE